MWQAAEVSRIAISMPFSTSQEPGDEHAGTQHDGLSRLQIDFNAPGIAKPTYDTDELFAVVSVLVIWCPPRG
jgi:hypothetical protein